MDGETGTLPLLRLFQLADSAFPIGAFAYSHGLETLAAEGRLVAEPDLADLLRRYIAQPVRGQLLPAARAAAEAASDRAIARADERFDVSLTLPGERAASAAMGRRLLDLAPELDPALRGWSYRAAVLGGASPGHHPVAFGALAARLGLPVRDSLAALGLSAVTSLVSAAARLGLIGPAASVRLAAGAAPALAAAVDAAVSGTARRTFGSWFPVLEIAAARHPTLPFRMFAT
ncbi:MAG: urease accessory protein UreF [Tepidiforma sp.]|nr:urease accessory UreF family protein [Tepidiforma sp.]GIW17803.1 MAG: urease accessory protein UreF [Tepidiforma sp.]